MLKNCTQKLMACCCCACCVPSGDGEWAKSH